MRYTFNIEFRVVLGSSEPLRVHVERVADVLHDDESVGDVSIGANLARQLVDVQVSAPGDTQRAAVESAMVAIVRAINSAGGELVDALTLLQSHPGVRAELPLGLPPPDRWSERRVELVDALA
jgi:hypothetical protein